MNVTQAELFNRTEIARTIGPLPRLYCGLAEALSFIADESVDTIITSPPYNLGSEKMKMGGNGRKPRPNGIGYDDDLPEDIYQDWQLDCLREWYRVARPGASCFYNHKERSDHEGGTIHPRAWLEKSPWLIRQTITWDRGSTHNHCAQKFWPHTELIFWLTKGKPVLPESGVAMPNVWRILFKSDPYHPAPFPLEIPLNCLEAVGRPGITAMDPFGGSMTTCAAAQRLGYQSIGVEKNPEYIRQAIDKWHWPDDVLASSQSDSERAIPETEAVI